jgi:hypothetical protein
VHEFAIGTKRTWASALQMSAFGGTADMGAIYADLAPRRHSTDKARKFDHRPEQAFFDKTWTLNGPDKVAAK